MSTHNHAEQEAPRWRARIGWIVVQVSCWVAMWAAVDADRWSGRWWTMTVAGVALCVAVEMDTRKRCEAGR